MPHDILPVNHAGYYYLSLLRFEIAEKNAWNIITRQTGYRKWGGSIQSEVRNALLPQYFPVEDHISYPYSLQIHSFYATYPLTNGELAMMAGIVGPPITRKYDIAGWNGEVVKEKEIIYTDDYCSHRKLLGVIASFNAVDVDFDTASLCLVRNGEKTAGMPIVGKGAMFVDIQKREHNIYNLASTATISKMQMYEDKVDRRGHRLNKFYNYPTFHYIFELTCADIEDAVLVIDGLYQKGERLPPLKVRMKYADFFQAPKYTGSEPARADR